VNVAAIGISGPRGDAAHRCRCFLSQGLLKEPSKGLFATVNARSVTARIFTEREHNAAPAHCNVGNHVMAMQVIVDWLDQCMEIDANKA